MMTVNYPRRQRNRRLMRGLKHAVLCALAVSLAGVALTMGWTSVAIATVGLGVLFAIRARRWLQLARRSDVGARSERRVRSTLGALERDGWTIRHALRWRDGGDIDHVAVAPATVGIAFAIETKTRSYRPRDLARISSIARWLTARRARWCQRGAVPVICLAGTHKVERWEHGVAIVSVDRLVPLLSRLAGTTRKPAFLR